MIGLKLAGPIISCGHDPTNKCMEASVDFARCIMESLVLRYREVFHSMHELKDVIINGCMCWEATPLFSTMTGV